MGYEEIFSTVAATITALIAALISSDLGTRLLERRQKVMISADAQEPFDGGAKIWRVKFVLNKPLLQTDPVICFYGNPSNRFLGYSVCGGEPAASRFRINEQGHLEGNISFTVPGSELEVVFRFQKSDTPLFYSDQKSLKIRINHSYKSVLSPQRLLLIAQWRVLWIVGVLVVVAILALVRLLHLGMR